MTSNYPGLKRACVCATKENAGVQILLAGL